MADGKRHVSDTLVALGDERAPERAAEILPQVYEELRALAQQQLRSERLDHTLQPTALVHEAFLRLVDQSRVNWNGRTHFLAVSAEAMRRVLIDHARAKGRVKRGGGRRRVVIEDAPEPLGVADLDVVSLHDALEELARLDPQQAKVVELRFFGGMTVAEVAHFMGVSKRKIEGDWTHAKAWLRAKLETDAPP